MIALVCCALAVVVGQHARAQKAAASQPCKGLSTPEAVVQAQVEAYNRHDVDGFANCYTQDAVIRDLAGKRPDLRGREAIREHYQFLIQGPSGYGVKIVKRIVGGAVIVDLEHPHDLPPGAPPRPDSVAVYEVRDGLIANVWFPPR